MGKTLIKMKMEKAEFPKQYIINNWSLHYNNFTHLERMQKNYLPSNQHNSFFPSYCLAIYFDNVDYLKKLCSQTKPHLLGAHHLFLLASNAPNCYIYLFEQYKDYFMTSIDDHVQQASNETIKNYLKQQQSSACTIQ
jgi:hypothetical protein